MAGRRMMLAGVLGAGIAEKLLAQRREEIERHYSTYFLDHIHQRLCAVAPADAMLAVIRQTDPAATVVPVGKGGVCAALWQLGEQEATGLKTSFEDLTIAQELIELFNYLGIDPYTSNDGGSVLIATAREQAVLAALSEKQIPARIIGAVTEDKVRVIMRGDTRCYINQPGRANT